MYISTKKTQINRKKNNKKDQGRKKEEKTSVQLN